MVAQCRRRGEAAHVARRRHGGNNTGAMRTSILAFLIALAGVASAQQPPAPPLMQEPQTILLWPSGAPGALGQEDRDKPAITVYMPPNTAGPMTAVIIAPGGSYARLSMNLEGRAPANYLNSLGIAAFVLRYRLGPALSPSDRARRRAARDTHGAIARGRVAHRTRSHRHHGVLRRRASRVERLHAFRRRQGRRRRSDRSRQQPSGLCGARLSGDLVRRAVHASGIEDEPARRESGSGAGAQPLERNAGDGVDAADVHLSHQRRHRGAGRERGGLLPGAAQGGRPGGDARLPERPARHGSRAAGSGARRMAAAAGELAPRRAAF